MSIQDWAKLERLAGAKSKGWLFDRLLARTEKEDEHPECYQGPCLCCLCRSYA